MNLIRKNNNRIKPNINPNAMNISTFYSCLIIIAVCTGLLAGCKDNVSPDFSDEIEDVINNVDKFQEAETYNQVEELGTDTAVTTTTNPVDGSVETTYFSCVTERHSVSENPQDFMMYDPLASVLWPGNLVQGNSIASGVPNSIPISQRSPGNITLAILSGDASSVEQEIFRTVEDFQFSSVNQAMNEILAGYEGGTPAKYSFSMQKVYSQSQFEFGLDVGYTGPSFNMSAQFGINWSEEKSRMVVKLSQKFFTMVFDDPEGASGVFPNDFESSRLTPYTGPGNPITYISSVTYGRIYYLLFESSASVLELEAALQAGYDGGVASGDLEAETAFNDVMQQTTVHAWQIGGDPEAGLNAADPSSFSDWSSVKSFLTDGANFSSQNVGEPISYTIKYLKDATLVRMNNTMEYEVQQCSPYATEARYPVTGVRIYVDKVEVLESAGVKIAPGDGGFSFAVSITDNKSGEHEVQWQNPRNQEQEDRFWYRLVNNGFYSGQSWNMGWTVPEFEIEKSTDQSIRIRIWGIEWYPNIPQGFFSGGDEIINLDFDPSNNRWAARSTLQDTTNIYPDQTDITIPGGWNTKLRVYYKITLADILPD